MTGFEQADLLDGAALDALFTEHGPFECVIHFAALKAVGESVSNPLRYYSNNLSGTFSLLGAMAKHNCKRIVFSSSATVYGSAPSPLTEASPVGTGITNPCAVHARSQAHTHTHTHTHTQTHTHTHVHTHVIHALRGIDGVAAGVMPAAAAADMGRRST
jgi:UDP-glucose 4-epimerase